MARGQMSATSSIVLWPGATLTEETTGGWEEVDGREPDPSWRYVDREGHGHFASKDGYQTLEESWSGCGDPSHGDECRGLIMYHCKFCGERIVPGTISAKPVWVPGPTTYELVFPGEDGNEYTYRFGAKEWQLICDAMRDAAVLALPGEALVRVRHG